MLTYKEAPTKICGLQIVEKESARVGARTFSIVSMQGSIFHCEAFNFLEQKVSFPLLWYNFMFLFSFHASQALHMEVNDKEGSPRLVRSVWLLCRLLAEI